MTTYWHFYASRVKRQFAFYLAFYFLLLLLHFTLYEHWNYGLNQKLVLWWLQIYMYVLDEENFGKQMTTAHLLHPNFLQFYAWDKENSSGFRCLIQLLLKVEVQIPQKSLIPFFSSVGKDICSFIPDAGIRPIFFIQFSSVLTSSCVGQGQNKGQSNSLSLLQLCKLKAVENTLFLSVTKEPWHVHPLSNLLKEKVEYVSPWCKMSGYNDPNLPV